MLHEVWDQNIFYVPSSNKLNINQTTQWFKHFLYFAQYLIMLFLICDYTKEQHFKLFSKIWYNATVSIMPYMVYDIIIALTTVHNQNITEIQQEEEQTTEVQKHMFYSLYAILTMLFLYLCTFTEVCVLDYCSHLVQRSQAVITTKVLMQGPQLYSS